MLALPLLFLALQCAAAAPSSQRYVALISATGGGEARLSALGAPAPAQPASALDAARTLLSALESSNGTWGELLGASAGLHAVLDAPPPPSRLLGAAAAPSPSELPLLLLSLTPAGAALLAAHPLVLLLEVDATVGPGLPLPPPAPAPLAYAPTSVAASSADSTTSLGLDRIDQRALPLDGLYTYRQSGVGTYIIVLDSGVRATHRDFGGRVEQGANFVGDQAADDASDTAGHGTCVASLAAGTVYGVAKGATVVPVRIYGAENTGPLSQVLLGVNWILSFMQRSCPYPPSAGKRRCVINMSFGGSASDIMDAAVARLLSVGGSVVVAAGNEAGDACRESPARAAGALTVGATALDDSVASFSNTGPCVSLYAPGTAAPCAGHNSDSSIQALSGTSMAAPLVAGTAALYLQANPGSSVGQVRQGVLCGATANGVSSAPRGSSSLMVYTEPSAGFPGPEEVTQCGISGAAGAGAAARALALALMVALLPALAAVGAAA